MRRTKSRKKMVLRGEIIKKKVVLDGLSCIGRLDMFQRERAWQERVGEKIEGGGGGAGGRGCDPQRNYGLSKRRRNWAWLMFGWVWQGHAVYARFCQNSQNKPLSSQMDSMALITFHNVFSNSLFYNIVCTPTPPTPFLLGELNLLPNFQKGSPWEDLNFERG